MGQSYFIWKNADCRSKGVTVAAPAQIVRGEERVSHVTIPGRAGELTLTEGNDIYQSYIQTVTIQMRGGYRVREILDWLKGDGYITFSGEPDRRQKARVIGAVSMNRHSRNSDYWTGEVQFYCEPLKELLENKTANVSDGSTVINTGDVIERPEIALKATATSATIGIGGKTLTMTNLTADNVYVIDSGAEMFRAGDVNATVNTSGEFPVLNPGSNTVSCSGCTAVTIYRKERFL